ncbi:pyrroline-5-carboxylate reductase [Coraliomargarita sp. SDUM461004]|uniref:Pyrroline-5-carboxylate reductase n=1 Tax=Thalassobacterium sedimentorum TaxID=3041258 RepID=A0ABU1AGR6_9BACT|nr:pyrroline-5-carboxylate reductase [Coraliomargarita sp. SDUM461004]MDQ8193980.1 pyrroline-5-carboxylate reductase [Coraliomargarita sp. SDUM461004]
MSIRIVFIGAGRMASAIVRGLLEKEHYTPEEIACTCGKDPTGPALAEATGIQFLEDITPALYQAEAVVLACKPQQFAAISPELAEAARGKLVLSILAGTPLSRLSKKFAHARNVVRTMPNTPGQIGAGVTAFAPLRELSEKDTAIVDNTLSSLGNFHQVEEIDLDAVTALSGSGPAYVFEFAAALRDAGVHCGLDEGLADALAIDTLLGAAMLLAESEDRPEELRDAVTSPGGTTAAALQVFQAGNFRGLIDQALAAAKARSLELAAE